MDEIHGSLISQADKVIDLIFTKYLKANISYEGVTRVETYPFPKAAIREAVYNAIVHKNYATQIPIQISIYKDKLYISNDLVFFHQVGQLKLLWENTVQNHLTQISPMDFLEQDL